MPADYFPVLVHFIIVVGLAAAILGVSAWVGVRRPSREKLSPYECGIAPVGDARERFSVSFYLVGMLFILFDVEAAFLYPWAVVYRSLKWFGFFEMFMFIVVLFAGFVYIWKKGALDWSR
ncbi:MAG: NADH-quinone oxidoreductase subunit A [Acidobacteria bacterium]|nr:MAG: NADH-quinone oxidoreductase subunit A [Acidobacteriota bacterium]